MPIMEASDLTARQYWEQVKANPNRAKFGFGDKAAVINIKCPQEIIVDPQVGVTKFKLTGNTMITWG